MGYRRLFLSYTNSDGEITDIVEEKLGEALRERYGDTFTITRYTHDEHYNKNFRSLMDSIPEHDAMVSIISKSYLESPACMYEISAASKRNDKGELCFPDTYYCIVLSKKERKKYHSKGRINDQDLLSRDDRAHRYYKTFWKKQLESVEKKLKVETEKGHDTKKLRLQRDDTALANALIDDYLGYVCKVNHTSFTDYVKDGFFKMADSLISRIKVPQYPEKLKVNQKFVESSCYREFVNKLNDEKRVILTGIPGSGKTEIIGQYIKHHGHRYREIVCIDCFSMRSMFMDISSWCGARKHQTSGKIENLMEDITALAKQLKGVLFIFENVMNANHDNPDERGIKDVWSVFERIMTDPEIESGIVAATNQVPANGALARMLMDCGGLDMEEARKLFFSDLENDQGWDYTHIKEDTKGVDDLLKELGGNPLAIRQAAQYIKSLNLSAKDYLQRLANYPFDVDERFTELFGGDKRTVVEGEMGSGLRGLCRSLRMIYDQISKENPLAKELLDRISFLSSAPVDEKFLWSCIPSAPDVNASDIAERERAVTLRRRAITLLNDYLVITKCNVEAGSWECKEIIRVLVRRYHSEAENKELLHAVSSKMVEWFDSRNEGELETREAQIMAAHAGYFIKNFGDSITNRDDLMLYVGNGLFVMGSYSASLDCFNQIDTTDPVRAYKVNFAKARSYDELSENQKLIDIYNNSLSSDVPPSRFACHVRMKQLAAYAYEEMKRYDDALALLNNILSVTAEGNSCADCRLCDRMRQRAIAFNCLGNINDDLYYGENVDDDSDKIFNSIKDQYENALSCLGVRSLIKILDQQDYDKLKPHALLAASIILNISELYMKDMRYDEAESFMKYAKRLLDEICSNLFENSKSLATFYFHQGELILNRVMGSDENREKEYMQAVECFNRCVDTSLRCGFSETTYPFSCYFYLGVIYSQWYNAPENLNHPKENLKMAIRFFEKMMTFEIDDSDIWVARKKRKAWVQMSFCYSYLGRTAESEKCMKKALNYAMEHGLD